MASGFFAVLDDIAALMDDVAMASKIATKKTAGILGDDLAVNADKATGFMASRELPVLWAITKGSFLNKLIIVPVALLLNYFLPIAIQIILVLGGLYLAYEGIEKIIHYFLHKKDDTHETEVSRAEAMTEEEVIAREKSKIKDAISTDFILSVEIVIIALGTALEQTLAIQIITVAIVSILATVGVYGIVALIVRMDDAGFRLIKKSDAKGWKNKLGEILVKSLPIVIRILSIVGTIALILVAGGIFAHNVNFIHHYLADHLTQLPSFIPEALLGIIGGIIAFGLVFLYKKIKSAVAS
ncbi:DUF808 family protein [Flavobacteriaceae bacterium Ap0902]|nr:DUF808 family protein [Flavobacteriaceae bacterium Ap0902]